MTLTVAAILVVSGLILLVAGGETLVRGAVAAARILRISPAVVGLTIVAFATSLPEMAVSLLAALRGSPDDAVGNVVGSNIFNLAVILGLSSLLFPPLMFRSQGVRKDIAAMFLSSILAAVWLGGGQVSRLEGILALSFLALFLTWRVRDARRYGGADAAATGAVRPGSPGADVPAGGPRADRLQEARPPRPSIVVPVLQVIFGAVVLTGGAEILVRGAVHIAHVAGVSERIIAITLVSAGTGLPELATAVVAGVRKHAGVAVGNVVGSNIFNVCGILGTVSVVHPVRVSPEIAGGDVRWMLGFCLVALFPALHPGRRLSRIEGLIAIAAYGLYLAWLL